MSASPECTANTVSYAIIMKINQLGCWWVGL